MHAGSGGRREARTHACVCVCARLQECCLMHQNAHFAGLPPHKQQHPHACELSDFSVPPHRQFGD